MPELKKRIPAIWKNAWKKDLSAKGTTTCRQLGCQFSCSSYDEMCKHSSECNFTPQQNYICKVCKFSTESKEIIFAHIKEQHSTEDNYSDTKQDTSSSTDEYDDDLFLHKFKQHMQYEKSRSHNYLYLDDRFSQRTSWNIPYMPALQWTMEFELENYQLELFKEYLPNTLKLLNNQDAEQYMPKLKRSMLMKILDVNVVTHEDKDEMKWKAWDRFEGAVIKGCPAFFTGGPVWALIWLPIPAGMYGQNVDQYIAVSTHPDMESEYVIGKAYSHSNLIQIWNVGKISNEIKTTVSTPVLSYAIAHNNGTIWCLEWCPSGCYQHENVYNYEKKKSRFTRMGLLAAGCSNGSVYVYSLPFPDEFINTDKTKSILPIYETEPVLVLVVNSIMYHNNNQNWQCTKLSWTKEHGHNTIAAGFSNGYIALWNLLEDSPLLVQKQKNTRIINAFMHFYAHSSAVSMVALIPYGGERFLVSASTDRCYKFWDLENVSNPQECIKKGIITDGSWMTHWPAAVISFDDALGYNHTNSYIIPLREHGFKYVPILATNSSTYSISVSDHANSIVHGTLAGEILSIFPHQLLYSKDIEKVLPKKRQLNSFIEVVDFKANESDSKETTEQPKEEEEKNSKEYYYMPETYDECKDRFGIIFYNNLTRSKDVELKDTPFKSLQADRLTAVPIERYPFTSVNKLAWNPNIWSYLWLATGYQNGLVRLLSFRFMSAGQQATKLLEGHAKRFINRSKT